MKLVYIIGQSASGKTTYIRERFLNKYPFELDYFKDIPIAVGEGVILLGNYFTGKRCVGTDTLSYTCLESVKALIESKRDEDVTLVAEGDRVTNKAFVDFITSLDITVEAIYFTCSIEDSVKRRVETGSKSSEVFVKTTATKSLNIYNYLKTKGITISKVDTSAIITPKQNSLF